MKDIEEYLTNGGIYKNDKFLTDKEFKDLQDSFKNLNFKATYQPEEYFYGNRFEAFPCWETEYFSKLPKHKKTYETFRKKVQSLFKRKLSHFDIKIRYILTDEVSRSAQNHKYGITHTDDSGYAGVFYFTQSINGGTAFFRNQFDKYPDVEIGASPNRAIIYQSNYAHAPCTDFNVKDRYALAIFFNLQGKQFN